MPEQTKEEILIQDIKDLLNQINIRLRLHDVGHPKTAYGCNKFEAIRHVTETMIKSIDDDDDTAIKDMIASTLMDYYSSSNC